MNLQDLRSHYREEIIRIALQHGAEDVRVFGSVARGESRPNDVDILVRFKPGSSLLDEAGLDLALNQLIGEKVDLLGEDTIREEFRPFILAEAVPL